jgi:hypothetical protein
MKQSQTLHLNDVRDRHKIAYILITVHASSILLAW